MTSRMTTTLDPNWKILDEEEDEKRWERLNKRAEGLTKDIYDSWKEELQNLLIFAGLFSAVVTAFTIEAAKTVQGDPADTTILLLRTIALQLSNQSNPQPNLSIDLEPNPTISIHAQQINLLYSVSLILSLLAVVGGIVCLQWLREFGRNINSVSHKEDLSLQFQRHESLRIWGVLALLNALPLLLLVALGLFLAGFMVSQWESHTLASVPVTCLVATCGLFIFITTILPAMQVIWFTGKTSRSRPHVLCPYRSPQAWLFHQMLRFMFVPIPRIFDTSWYPACLKRFINIRNWIEYDTSTQGWKSNASATQSMYFALVWLSKECRQTGTIVQDAYFCLLLASCSKSWKKLKEKCTPNEITALEWKWDALDLLGRFATDININDTKLFWNIRTKAVIDVIVEWNRSDYSELECPLPDISSLEKLSYTNEDRKIRSDLLDDITHGLENPGSSWITDETGVNVICHVIHQDTWHWHHAIPILRELCKNYSRTRSLRPIRMLCSNLRVKLVSEHRCDNLVRIFNRTFPDVDSAHLDDLGVPLGSLLVRCDECFIHRFRVKPFLKIIERLASQRLIAKEHSLDNIFLFTTHVLERSWGLPDILPSIEKTSSAILAAAKEHVQIMPSETDCVLHPSRFFIPHTIPYRYLHEDLKQVWRSFDDFNIRLTQVWDNTPGSGVHTRSEKDLE